jgi:hypothetical protein
MSQDQKFICLACNHKSTINSVICPNCRWDSINLCYVKKESKPLIVKEKTVIKNARNKRTKNKKR